MVPTPASLPRINVGPTMNDQARIGRIAEILREQYPGPCDCGTCTAVWAHHVASILNEELNPVIETVEQLDALPMGTVVRTDEGRVALKSGERWANASGYGSWWSTADEEEFDCTSDELDDLPARVLYTPEADR